MGGAVAAGDPQTAAAGLKMLQAGGNAVDAAVAAAFASFVAEAVLVNIGGGGIGAVYDPHRGRGWSYDFFSAMPSGPLGPDSDFREVVVDFGSARQSFHIGRASVAVPGVVAGLCRMAAEWGRLPLAQILAPAVELAQEGARLSPALDFVAKLLTPIFTDTASLAAVFAPTGRMVRGGESIAMPHLADTLRELGRTGASLFYTGPVGQAIVADQAQNGGLMTGEDLAAYRVVRRDPISVPYRGYTILLPPPASSGGVLLAFALLLLSRTDVGRLPFQGPDHVELLHRVMAQTELARREWEESVGTVSQRIGSFLTRSRVERHWQALCARPPGPAPHYADGSADTTHISVVDREGLTVALTTSAGENAGFLVGDTGVCLNNMLGEQDLHPRGFHRLAPGERLTTMMSPTLVLAGGRPVLALGSGGSSRIRSALLQALNNVLDFGMPLAAAVEAPRIHSQDGVIQVEGTMAPATVAALRDRGYSLNLWPDVNMYFGGVHGVMQDRRAIVAAGDPRRGGSVAIAP